MSWLCKNCGKTNIDGMKHCLTCSTTKEVPAADNTLNNTPEQLQPIIAPVEKIIEKKLPQEIEPVKIEPVIKETNNKIKSKKINKEELKSDNNTEALEILADETTPDPEIKPANESSSKYDSIKNERSSQKFDLSLVKYIVIIIVLITILIISVSSIKHKKTSKINENGENNFISTGNQIVNIKQKSPSSNVIAVLSSNINVSANTTLDPRLPSKIDEKTGATNIKNNTELGKQNEISQDMLIIQELKKYNYLAYYKKTGVISENELKSITEAATKPDKNSKTAKNILTKIMNTDIYYLQMAKINIKANKKNEAEKIIKKLKEKYPDSPLNAKAAQLVKKVE